MKDRIKKMNVQLIVLGFALALNLVLVIGLAIATVNMFSPPVQNIYVPGDYDSNDDLSKNRFVLRYGDFETLNFWNSSIRPNATLFVDYFVDSSVDATLIFVSAVLPFDYILGYYDGNIVTTQFRCAIIGLEFDESANSTLIKTYSYSEYRVSVKVPLPAYSSFDDSTLLGFKLRFGQTTFDLLYDRTSFILDASGFVELLFRVPQNELLLYEHSQVTVFSSLKIWKSSPFLPGSVFSMENEARVFYYYTTNGRLDIIITSIIEMNGVWIVSIPTILASETVLYG